jgi:hypothetical protein
MHATAFCPAEPQRAEDKAELAFLSPQPTSETEDRLVNLVMASAQGPEFHHYGIKTHNRHASHERRLMGGGAVRGAPPTACGGRPANPCCSPELAKRSSLFSRPAPSHPAPPRPGPAASFLARARRAAGTSPRENGPGALGEVGPPAGAAIDRSQPPRRSRLRFAPPKAEVMEIV